MKRFLSTIFVSVTIFLILFLLRIFHVTENMLILSGIAAVLFSLGAFFLRLLSPRVRTAKFFGLRQMNFLEWRITLCFSLILIFGSLLLNLLTDRFLRLLMLSPGAADSVQSSSPWVSLLCVAVLPAFFEELYFRGAVQSTLRIVRVKSILVILIPAVLFAFMHGNLRYFVSNLFAGLLLSYLMYLTGSCIASIAAHFLSNFVAFYLSIYSARLFASGDQSFIIHMAVICLIGAVCHALHLIKKRILQQQAEDRSGINENARRWEKMKQKEVSHDE